MTPMTLGLKDRVAIVTGGARGIGLAGVRRLAAEGVHVLVFDVEGADFSEALSIMKAHDVRIVPFKGDVARADDWLRAISIAKEALGRLDILFSNAGISGDTRPVLTYDEDVYDRVMAVNAKGVFLGLKHVGGAMAQAGAGVIVNVSSISGMGGGGNVFAYTASKHAVIGMTKSAAVHMARMGVRVVCLCPCPTETEMMAFAERMVSPDNPGAARYAFSQNIPLGRYGQPDEIGNVLAFVVSDHASFMTGTIIPVDGGIMAR